MVQEFTAISWGHGQEQSIDHILVKNNNKIAVSSHEVIVGQELSDHRPVMVHAEIK